MGEFPDRLVSELIEAVKKSLKKEQSERLRDVYLIGDIEKDNAPHRSSSGLRELANEGRGPINLYVNTAGGNVTDGLAIHDAILHLVSEGMEVTIIVQGMAYSMGSVVLQAASPGRRFSFPHAWIMIHEPAKWAGWQSTTAAAQHLDRLKQMQSQIYRILSARSGRPLRQIIRDTKRTDFYLDATQGARIRPDRSHPRGHPCVDAGAFGNQPGTATAKRRRRPNARPERPLESPAVVSRHRSPTAAMVTGGAAGRFRGTMKGTPDAYPFPTLAAPLRFGIGIALISLIFILERGAPALIDDGSHFILLGTAVGATAWFAGTGPALLRDGAGLGVRRGRCPRHIASAALCRCTSRLFLVHGLLLTGVVAELRRARRNAEERAREANAARREGEAANRMKDEFLAHDFARAAHAAQRGARLGASACAPASSMRRRRRAASSPSTATCGCRRN